MLTKAIAVTFEKVERMCSDRLAYTKKLPDQKNLKLIAIVITYIALWNLSRKCYLACHWLAYYHFLNMRDELLY